jgi:hypothetical protein
MEELDRYLDLYRVGDSVQRGVATMRVGPETGFFNPPFPVMRSGLSGLGRVTYMPPRLGERLPRPTATTMPDGYVAPPAEWLQRAINAYVAWAPTAGVRTNVFPVAVDGVAGPQTLAAVVALSREINPQWAPPYLTTIAGTPVQRTVAMKQDVLSFLTSKPLVEVAPPAPSGGGGGGGGGGGEVPLEPLPPAPSSGGASGFGSGAFLLVAAAVVAGVYFSRR